MSTAAGTVLILDDEDAIRESFAYYFEDQGWHVLTAGSAEEALERLSREGPADGAVVDLRLPGISGEEFIKRAVKTFPRTVFVICTGYPEYSPDLLSGEKRISPVVFNKPVGDMDRLERELLRLIGQCAGPGDEKKC